MMVLSSGPRTARRRDVSDGLVLVVLRAEQLTFLELFLDSRPGPGEDSMTHLGRGVDVIELKIFCRPTHDTLSPE